MLSFRSWFTAAAVCSLLALMPAASPAANPTSGGPSFNCQRASSKSEKAICANPRLSALDRQIGVRYAALLRQMDKPSAEALKKDQRWFIATRDSKFPDHRFSGLSEALQSRLAFLNAIRPSSASGLTGKWRNMAGEINISPSGSGGPLFEANASEPVTGGWVCEVTGHIIANGPGKWTAQVTEPTNAAIDVERQGTRLVLTEPGDVEYCGMNGFLAGSYFPVATPPS